MPMLSWLRRIGRDRIERARQERVAPRRETAERMPRHKSELRSPPQEDLVEAEEKGRLAA